MLVTSGKDVRYVKSNLDFYRRSRERLANTIAHLQRIFSVWTESMLMNLFSRCEDNFQAMLKWIDSLIAGALISSIKRALGHDDISEEEFLKGAIEEVGDSKKVELLIREMYYTLQLLRKVLPIYFFKFYEGEWNESIFPKLKEECESVRDELEKAEIDIVGILEDFTGKKSPVNLIKACPSPLVPKYRGYGVIEKGDTLAIIHKSSLLRGKAVLQLVHMSAHELLHYVINNPPLWKNLELKCLFEKWLTHNPRFERMYRAKFGKSYINPRRFFEENLVLALSHVILERLGFVSKEDIEAINLSLFREGFLLVPSLYKMFKQSYDKSLYSNVDMFIAYLFKSNALKL